MEDKDSEEREKSNLLRDLLGHLAFLITGERSSRKPRKKTVPRERTRQICLSGGSSWELEAFFSKLPGVVKVITGYANGNINNPTYELVQGQKSGFAHAVLITYDIAQMQLDELLDNFFNVIDPTSFFEQKGCKGHQYRLGIFYMDADDQALTRQCMADAAPNYGKPLNIELALLMKFYAAEPQYQNYFSKNPDKPCLIDMSRITKYRKYARPNEAAVRDMLTPLQYNVVRYKVTEHAYSGEYTDFFEDGIYVDIITGEPLFCSADKYDSGTGWPAFTKPIDNFFVMQRPDRSGGVLKTEVISKIGGSHLGHIYKDGPANKGGLRYRINSAAVRFVPAADMTKEGYGEYMPLLKPQEEKIDFEERARRYFEQQSKKGRKV